MNSSIAGERKSVDDIIESRKGQQTRFIVQQVQNSIRKEKERSFTGDLKRSIMSVGCHRCVSASFLSFDVALLD